MLMPAYAVETRSAGQYRRKRTKLLAERLELIKVLLILLLVLNLLLDTLEDPDGSCIVIDATRGTNGGLDNGGCGNEIVGENEIESAPLLAVIASVPVEPDLVNVTASDEGAGMTAPPSYPCTSAVICALRHSQSFLLCTGVPSLKRKGFGSLVSLKPEMVDGVAHEPGTAVDVTGAELGALGDVVGAGAVVGAGVVEGAAAPGRH